jgi:uncharacterized protein YoxC
MVSATVTLFVLQNVAPGIADAVQRIAVMQTMMAIAVTVIALLFLGAGVVGIITLRRMNVVLRALEDTVAILKPRAEPILDALNVMARDAAALTGAVRGRVDALMRTVDELHAEVRETAAEARIRVKQFGAVLDIVQEEAEDLLLDAAATARGVHTTAERLRDPDSLAERARTAAAVSRAVAELPEPPESVVESELLGGTTVSMPLEP